MPITASNKFKRIVKQHQSSMYGFPARKQSRCQYKVDPSSTQTRQIEALISPARTPPRSLSPQPAPLHITHAVAQPSLSTPTKQIEALISPARTPPRQSPQPTSTLLHKKQDTSPPSLLTPTKQIEAPVSPARTPPQSSSPQSAQKPLRGRHVTPPPPIPPHQRSNSSPEPKSPGGLGAAMRSDSQLLGRRRKKASITLPTSDVVDNANNNQFLSVKMGPHLASPGPVKKKSKGVTTMFSPYQKTPPKVAPKPAKGNGQLPLSPLATSTVSTGVEEGVLHFSMADENSSNKKQSIKGSVSFRPLRQRKLSEDNDETWSSAQYTDPSDILTHQRRLMRLSPDSELRREFQMSPRYGSRFSGSSGDVDALSSAPRRSISDMSDVTIMIDPTVSLHSPDATTSSSASSNNLNTLLEADKSTTSTTSTLTRQPSPRTVSFEAEGDFHDESSTSEGGSGSDASVISDPLDGARGARGRRSFRRLSDFSRIPRPVLTSNRGQDGVDRSPQNQRRLATVDSMEVSALEDHDDTDEQHLSPALVSPSPVDDLDEDYIILPAVTHSDSPDLMQLVTNAADDLFGSNKQRSRLFPGPDESPPEIAAGQLADGNVFKFPHGERRGAVRKHELKAYSSVSEPHKVPDIIPPKQNRETDPYSGMMSPRKGSLLVLSKTDAMLANSLAPPCPTLAVDGHVLISGRGSDTESLRVSVHSDDDCGHGSRRHSASSYDSIDGADVRGKADALRSFPTSQTLHVPMTISDEEDQKEHHQQMKKRMDTLGRGLGLSAPFLSTPPSVRRVKLKLGPASELSSPVRPASPVIVLPPSPQPVDHLKLGQCMSLPGESKDQVQGTDRKHVRRHSSADDGTVRASIPPLIDLKDSKKPKVMSPVFEEMRRVPDLQRSRSMQDITKEAHLKGRKKSPTKEKAPEKRQRNRPFRFFKRPGSTKDLISEHIETILNAVHFPRNCSHNLTAFVNSNMHMNWYHVIPCFDSYPISGDGKPSPFYTSHHHHHHYVLQRNNHECDKATTCGMYSFCTDSERRIRQAIWELFRSECVYFIDSLLVLSEIFMPTLDVLKSHDILNDVDSDLVFGNLRQLCESSGDLCARILSLFTRHGPGRMGGMAHVANIFENFAWRVHGPYSLYAANYYKSSTYINSLLQRKDFLAYEAFCKHHPRAKKRTLKDFLIEPVTHLPHFILVLKDITKSLKKDTEHQRSADLSLLSSTITAIGLSCHQTESKFKQFELARIASQLSGAIVWPKFQLVDPRAVIPEGVGSLAHDVWNTLAPLDLEYSDERFLKHRGLLKLYERIPTNASSSRLISLTVSVFLFNDLLLVTKPVARSAKSSRSEFSALDNDSGDLAPDLYEYHVHRPPCPLDRLDIYDVPATSVYHYAFCIMQISRFRQVQRGYTLEACDARSKEQWMDAIKDAKLRSTT